MLRVVWDPVGIMDAYGTTPTADEAQSHARRHCLQIAMGYDEEQYSLPRAQWLTLARQQMYDNTFDKLPTQGWMFLPLDEYHGGGAAATLEPLDANLREYRHAAADGVMACCAA